METWLFLALLYPLCYGTVNVIEKFLLEKRIRNFYSYGVLIGVIYLIEVAVIGSAVGFPGMSLPMLALAIVAGVCSACSHFFYFYTMKFHEVSRIIGVIYLYPVFVAVLSFFLLGERLSLMKYAAIVVAILGVTALGMERHRGRWKMKSVVLFLIAIALFISIIDMVDKYLLGHFSFWQVYIAVTLPVGIILLFPALHKDVRRDMPQAMKSILPLAVITLVGLAASVMFLNAANVAPVSIVSALGTLQPAYVFLITLLLSLFMPHIIKEALAPGIIIYKIVGILCIVAAAVILSF